MISTQFLVSSPPKTSRAGLSPPEAVQGRSAAAYEVASVYIIAAYPGRDHAMKADDPRLEASRKELFERIKKMDELMLTVLKNHVGLEQFLSEFLEASGKKPDEMSFYEKAKECEGLRPPEVEPAIWKVLCAANELRNKIAHTFEQAKIKAKMDALRAAYPHQQTIGIMMIWPLLHHIVQTRDDYIRKLPTVKLRALIYQCRLNPPSQLTDRRHA
jgi:hypothetical protein